MTIHRVAAVGNSVVVVLLVLAAAGGDRLVTGEEPAATARGGDRGPRATPAAGARPARRVVVVVIDGLRADAAGDAGLMPSLCRLAAGGGRGTARVEGLVPSSIGGIIALASGRVAPAAAALADFGAMARDEGGVFEAVVRGGGRCFVAGPRLWTDLYGRWIAGSEVDASFGRGDQRLVEATRRAIDSGAYRLVVLHLGRVDSAAHAHGTRSAESRAAVRWCDDAVAEIACAMGPETGLIVTSDHGSTDRGGHAGPEPSVLATPLVTHGPGLPAGVLGERPQRAVPSLVLEALGCDAPAMGRDRVRSGVPRLAAAASLALALLGGLGLWSGLRGEGSGRAQATALNAAVWAQLAGLVLGWVSASLATGLAVLAWGALPGGTGRVSWRLAVACGAGAILGVLRLADGLVTLDRPTPAAPWLTLIALAAVVAGAMPRLRSGGGAVAWVGPAAGAAAGLALGGSRLLLVYGAALSLGWALGRLTGRRPVAAGLLAAAGLALVTHAAGETTSLSTVDVRAAFGLVDRPWGLALAIAAVAASQAIPAAGLLLGLRPRLSRLAADPMTDFAAGLAAALVGQAAVGACGLWWAADRRVTALGFGLSARVMAETLGLFLGLAAVVLARGRRARPAEMAGSRETSGPPG